jgi:hypothetical protein
VLSRGADREGKGGSRGKEQAEQTSALQSREGIVNWGEGLGLF